MNQELLNRREELRSLSTGFAIGVREGILSSVNQGLVNYYREQGHHELKPFNRWKEEGFKIKKGSKALLLWGEPKKKKTEAEKEQEEEAGKFFPVAYVFSNLQVEPMQ